MHFSSVSFSLSLSLELYSFYPIFLIYDGTRTYFFTPLFGLFSFISICFLFVVLSCSPQRSLVDHGTLSLSFLDSSRFSLVLVSSSPHRLWGLSNGEWDGGEWGPRSGVKRVAMRRRSAHRGQHGANRGPSEGLNRPMGNGPGMGWGNGDKMAGEERDGGEWESVGERGRAKNGLNGTGIAPQLIH